MGFGYPKEERDGLIAGDPELHGLLSSVVDGDGIVRFRVGGLNSIAHLLPKAHGRCGVYELTFADGERYVGQAVDVVTRFCAHRRTWSDIVELAFRRVSRTHLDEVERAQIRRREAAGVRLRNVVHTMGRLGASELDVLLPPAEQQRWLVGHGPREVRLADRPNDTVLHHRGRHRFARLTADPRFTDELTLSPVRGSSGLPASSTWTWCARARR
ncbi:GIY-YIG nuclease family protein [Micromonospora sp. WMMD980]|uniref:GIY-YIG nuclease family protein n=1 Tax=Micromonospora sp. WMMD980 TaxID=3016088 RepID=UPI002415A5F5|nr:GIY-YIG nuclease family protein [Micromonospora sp. WMMD980]MDG4800278.1 GIY-YIG nuclease family protein [Micromonospora sp. WMMD980]